MKDGQETLVFDDAVTPQSDPNDRKWIRASVELSKWQRKKVTFMLKTSPLDNDGYDWALWADFDFSDVK